MGALVDHIFDVAGGTAGFGDGFDDLPVDVRQRRKPGVFADELHRLEVQGLLFPGRFAIPSLETPSISAPTIPDGRESRDRPIGGVITPRAYVERIS
jgi:hypothetical protein